MTPSLTSAAGANVRLATPSRTSATPVGASRPPNQSVTLWLVVVLVVVLFSGGLFGYDQGVISGALFGALAVFQQITGFNAIICYADQIFGAAGFVTQSSKTTVTTWAIGGVNVLATLIAIASIDRLGRRKLLLAGLTSMAISPAAVGIAFRFIGTAGVGAAAAPSGADIVMLFALIGFIICFAFSMGPVSWTVINEILPGHIRGRAVAVATAVNWGSAFLVTQFFLSLIGAIGDSRAFWLFGLFCVLAWVWIYFRVPETKGQSLEQIQQLWNGPARC